MRILLSIILANMVGISCTKQSVQEQAALEKMKRILASYGVDQDFTQLRKRDFVFFSKQGRWVSNYHLIIKRGQGDFKIIYHEVDKMNKEFSNDVIFFQGVTFYMDSTQLSEFFHCMDTLKSTVSEDSYSDGVLDGADYLFYYGGHAYVINQGGNKKQFDNFSTFLVDSLITPVMNLKKVFPSE